MAERHGRRVPAHFGSTAAEEAVCLRSVGMADRSDRDTFELRGTPSAIEQRAGRARRVRLVLVHRRRPRARPLRAEHAAACAALLASLDGLTASNRTRVYAAIGLIGPRAKELLEGGRPQALRADHPGGAGLLRDPPARRPRPGALGLPARGGPPYDLACVGHDALDRLAAAHRFD